MSSNRRSSTGARSDTDSSSTIANRAGSPSAACRPARISRVADRSMSTIDLTRSQMSQIRLSDRGRQCVGAMRRVRHAQEGGCPQ